MNDIFIIAGAQRCGTTFLYSQLDQHPQIEMAKPQKPEPKYFLNKNFDELSRVEYLKTYFNTKNANIMLGEKSTSYIEHPESGKKIKNLFPNAKIIILLRNPSYRAISNYFFSVKNGFEKRSLKEVFIDNKPIDFPSYATSVSPYKYIERGFYIYYLKKFFSNFPSKNIKVMLFEQLVGNSYYLKNILQFLRVDDTFITSDFSVKINNASILDNVDDNIIHKLNSIYKTPNKELSNYLDIDIFRWW